MKEIQTYIDPLTNRLMNDKGQVAVTYSPGYGAGWSTWNTDFVGCEFNPIIAQAVLDGKTPQELSEIAEKEYPDAYTGGMRDATVAWLDKGTLFIIDEYDGSESIQANTGTEWSVA